MNRVVVLCLLLMGCETIPIKDVMHNHIENKIFLIRTADEIKALMKDDLAQQIQTHTTEEKNLREKFEESLKILHKAHQEAEIKSQKNYELLLAKIAAIFVTTQDNHINQ